MVHFICFSASISAQDEAEKNIVINQCNRNFSFVKGNAENPVQIKEKSERTYFCNEYRANTQVVEFYNDIERIDDLEIRVSGSKKHGIIPKYEYYSSEGIFYSDAHVCYFSLPVEKKGATSEVTIDKTILDPKYFTQILFADNLPIVNQTITIEVPEWMDVEIKEYNFEKYSIQRNKVKEGVLQKYTYTIKNVPALKKERAAPGVTYFAPHVLVLCKSAKPDGASIVYFKTLADQYKWYRDLVKQIGNDEAFVRQKAAEIVAGMANDEDKVKAIFRWVQDNIRYIAFENGIAGFKPEKAQEVLKKKYGDCKGMANLLTEMLKSQKLDARRCWIGTRHIAYDYSTPSLSVDNHMIAVWMQKDKPIFLDATEKYIGFGEVAERIQGRQTLIENGDKYLLYNVPEVTYSQNTALETRRLTLEGNNLKGHVVQTWKGENKAWLLTQLFDIKQEKVDQALKQYLAEGKTNFEVSNLVISNLENYNEDLKAEYDIVWKDAASAFGKETYLDVNNRRSLEGMNIDTTKRKLPYWFGFKDHIVFETELNYPATKTPTHLPEKLTLDRPAYSFTGIFTNTPGKLIYKCELKVSKTALQPAQFEQWNADIKQLNEFYNQQIVLLDK